MFDFRHNMSKSLFHAWLLYMQPHANGNEVSSHVHLTDDAGGGPPGFQHSAKSKSNAAQVPPECAFGLACQQAQSLCTGLVRGQMLAQDICSVAQAAVLCTTTAASNTMPELS